jgi:RNA polymerase sigma factor (sigma-70 family)
MANRRAGDVGPQLQTLFVLGSPSDLTDGQLLERFAVGDGQASSLAFEALIDRHGSMVLRVCRGVLGDRHDAQDAFQATFLILVKKAGSIRDRDSLACWLHGVALRVASHARVDSARRRRHEGIRGEAALEDRTIDDRDDLGARLHEELGRLPERYRAPVVLCYLEGRTCEDAARALRWPVGTVKSRLSRARERLRSRLTRLGLAPASAIEGPPGARMVPPLPPRLTKATAEAAGRFGARSSAPSPDPGAVALAEGVLKAMTLSKLKWPAMALVAAASWLGISSATTPGQAPPKAPTPPKKITPAAQIPEADPSPLVAPRDLTATAGSGGVLMYALNDKGERIMEGPARDPNLPPPPGNMGPWKEVVRDVRWVAVVGVLDHWLIRERAARARGLDPGTFQQEYKRADVDRQVRQPDGQWSEWARVDQSKNYEIIDNLPELDAERTPEEVRTSAFVDPLPFLKKGTWSGVDPEVLLKLPAAGNPPAAGSSMRGMMGGARPGKPLSPVIMVRSLDFTVEPGKTYRYRVRVVVKNTEAGQGKEPKELFGVDPGGGGRDVRRAGQGKEPKELFGPWSVATAEAVVP